MGHLIALIIEPLAAAVRSGGDGFMGSPQKTEYIAR